MGLFQTLSETQSKPEVCEEVRKQGMAVLTQNDRMTGRTNCTSHAFCQSPLSSGIRIGLRTGVDSALRPLRMKPSSETSHDFQGRPLPCLESCNQNPSHSCHGVPSCPKSDPSLFVSSSLSLDPCAPSGLHSILLTRHLLIHRTHYSECLEYILLSPTNLLLCIFKFCETIKRPSLSPGLGSISLVRC